MRTRLSLLLFLGLCGVAHARDAGDALSVLVGTSTAFDGNPATARLSIRGEYGFEEGDWLGAYFLVPLTWSTEGKERFGLSPSQSFFELPLSLRGRLLPDGILRLYGDVGFGVVFGASRFDGWFLDAKESRWAFMTRTAVGGEFGNPNTWSITVEPGSWSTYYASRRLQATYGLMLGLVIAL